MDLPAPRHRQGLRVQKCERARVVHTRTGELPRHLNQKANSKTAT